MSRSLYARLHRRYGPRRDGVTRREALKVLAAGAGALLLSSGCGVLGGRRSGSVAALPGGKKGRVLVVGAGYAGLACAYELAAAGFEVTVLEARNRVGGRVLSFTDVVPGKVMEGGAELIGSNHAHWVAYAARFGLDFLDVTEDESLDAPIHLEGRLLSATEAEALYHEMDAALASMNDDARGIDAERAWLSPKAAGLDAQDTFVWLKTLDVSPLTRHALDVQFTADNGVQTVRQSYLGNLAQVKGGGVEDYWTVSEVYRCRGGNGLLGRAFAEALGERRIRLGAPVAAIESGADPARVTLRDGSRLEADVVVLAVPPSVWGGIGIDPMLPATLVPQMGSNVKYLARLRSRFWRSHGLSPDALLDADAQMTWDGTDNQPGDAEAGMVAFSGGDAAERLCDLTDAARDARYAEVLGAVYPDFAAQRTGSRFMGWPRTPWTMAGYSFPAPGQVTTVGPMLYEGRGGLLFAGEHTCYGFVGYMEGALQSGVRAARQAAARMGVASGT